MNSTQNDKGAKEHPLALFRFCPRCGSAHFVAHDEKSKRCEACGFVYYFNPSAATVGVVINARGELLCVRRAKEPARGTLDLPGGFSDLHETSEEGVVRELYEETGLRCTVEHFLFSIPNTYLYSGFVVHTIDMFYLMRPDDEAVPHAMDDAAEAMWLPLRDLDPALFGLDSIREGVEVIRGYEF